MNKLKKYYITTSKYNLEKLSNIKLKELRTKEYSISFYVDEENYQIIKDKMELTAVEVGLSRFKGFIKKQLITILGIAFIILALINQSMSISGVRFTNPDTYNEELLEYLNKYYNKVGPYRYLNDDLNTINLDLRKTFFHYEWIGLRKNGSYLYLDIREIKKNPSYQDDIPGSYYANVDGIVKRYHLEKGIILVQEEQYVVKGEKLISGEIPKLNNEVDFIRANGYVIAEVLQYREFYFNKENVKTIRTGKLIKSSYLYVFNLRLGKSKNKFLEFEIEDEVSFNLFNLLKKKDVYYYELSSVKDIYNEDDAVLYAKSLVEKEFRRNKVNPFEKIIFSELVKIELIDQQYYVKLIVKTYQNIAEFVPDEIRQ